MHKEQFIFFASSITARFLNLFGNKNADFKHITIVKLDEIGDFITSLHVIHQLKKNYPTATFTIYCKKFNNDLVKYLDMQVVNDPKHLPSHCDLLVDLRGDFNTVGYALKKRPKYYLDRGTIRLKNKFANGQKNELDTNWEIIRSLPNIPTTPIHHTIVTSAKEREVATKYVTDNTLHSFVICHISSRVDAKKWSIERYAEVITHINNKYKLPCLLIGTNADKEANEQCLQLASNPINKDIAGVFSLLELTEVMKKAALFVGNDSGPMHIAASVDIPLITIFGPGPKDIFYPRASTQIIHHFIPEHDPENTRFKENSVLNISVEDVCNSVNQLLGE